MRCVKEKTENAKVVCVCWNACVLLHAHTYMFMFRDDATGKSSLEVTRLGVVSRLVRLSERAPMTDDLPWRGTQA